MNVLIVDDNPNDRKLLRYNLERHGCENIIEAGDGQEGLETAKLHKPDLIISDALMPRMDGFQFLRAIKVDPELKTIPFIFHSSVYTGFKEEQLALTLGAEAFIVKPKEPEELWKIIEGIMKEETVRKPVPEIELVEEEREYIKKYTEIVTTKLEEKIRELEEALTRRREAEKEINFLASIVKNVPFAVVSFDPRGNIISWNEYAEKMLGYMADEVLGKPFSVIFPKESVENDIDTYIGKLNTEGFFKGFETTRVSKEGQIVPVEITAIALKDEEQKISSYTTIMNDITERKQSEERLRRHMDNLDALRTIDTAISGSFDLRITLNVILQQTIKQLRVDASCFLRFNPHSQMFEYAAGQGFNTNIIDTTKVRLGGGYAGRAALERKTRIIYDISVISDEPSPRDLVEKEGFRAYVGVPLIAKGQVKGVLEIYNREPLKTDRAWLEFIEALAGQAAIALDNSELLDNLQRSHSELLMAYETTIEGWSRALDLRDQETEGHSQRVTDVTVRISRAMGITEEELVHVRRGALLHDIGKLGVPDGILLKSDALTDEEWGIMKQHPNIAYKVLSPILFLRQALDIPYCHHENWDGSGYPRGLQGKEIPLAARIFAVIDVWDALRSDRPYRGAWPQEKVIEYISSLSGTKFQPEVVDMFLRMEIQK